MTLFGLVRHGQTDYNRRNLFQGSSDIPLNETGIEQAHRALDLLPEIPWDVVVCSPLQRAEQTARIIAADHGIPFGGTEARLVEIDWGEAEGRPVQEVETAYPERSFPGREDHQAVADRGYDALEGLEQRFPGKNVLVVSHGTLIRFILSGIIERPLDSLPNATLSVVTLEDTTWGIRMIAGDRVENTVKMASRDQNPRFFVEKAYLTPGVGQAPGRKATPSGTALDAVQEGAPQVEETERRTLDNPDAEGDASARRPAPAAADGTDGTAHEGDTR